MDALRFDPALAASLAEKLIVSNDRLPEPVLAQALWIQGSGLSISEQHQKAMSVLSEAERLSRKLNDKKLLRRTLRYKAASALECSEFRIGRDAACEAIQLSEKLEDKTAYVARLHNEAAGNEAALGDKQSAMRHLRIAIDISQRCNDKKGLVQWLVNLSSMMLEFGQHSQAIESCREVLNLEGEDTMNLAVITAHQVMGVAYLESDKLSDAHNHLSKGLRLCAAPGSENIKGTIEAFLGKLNIAMSAPAQATQHFQNSLTIFRALGSPSGIAAAEQGLRDSNEANAAANIRQIQADLERAEASSEIDLQISLHKELADNFGIAKLWQESAAHERKAAELEQQLVQQSFDDQVAHILADLSHDQKLKLISNLESEVSARSELLRSEQWWNFTLAICVGVMLVVLAMIAGLLIVMRRALKAVREAKKSLREQEALRLQMERRLAEQQKHESLAVMASGIAHDFNNLLAGIAGLAELAEISVSPDRKNELLNQITETSLQASGLTGQLMQFLGKPASEADQCDVTDVLESTKGLLQSVARPNALSLEGRAEPLFAEIDGTQLRQILVNLVANAAEASSSDGTIIVSADSQNVSAEQLVLMRADSELPPGRYHRIIVTDSGHGMTKETMDRLFDPYFSTKSVGRGLGLSSVIGIVRSCRGFAHVQSEPKKGCRFSIYLRPAQAATTVEHSDDHPGLVASESSSAAARPQILIVDDERLILDMQSEYLEVSGFSATTASSAEEAFELVKANPKRFDCVITDFCMGGHDGKLLANQIRTLSPGIPVILCSGFSGESLMAGKDVSNVLAKPYSPKALVGLIRETLRTMEFSDAESDEPTFSRS